MRDIRVTQYARAQEAQDMPGENIEHAKHVCQTHTMHVEHRGTTREDISCPGATTWLHWLTSVS